MKLYKRVLFGIIYTVVYVALAIEIVGAEAKGTAVFFAPLITWIFVLVAILLLAEEMSTFRRISIAVILGAHYGVTMLSTINYFADEGGHFAHSWNRNPESVVLVCVWYIIGQIVIWWTTFRNLHLRSRLS